MKYAFLFILLFPMNGIAQNYQIVRSDFIHFFLSEATSSYEGSKDHGLRMDSVAFDGGDSVFFNYLTLRHPDNDPGFIYAFVPSWLGEKIIVKPNGESLLFNQVGDTVLIRTQAQLNDSWSIFPLDSISYLVGTITDVSTTTVLDSVVEVKTISIQRKDFDGFLLSHGLNGKTIRISNSMGIVQGLDFHLFPNDTVQIEMAGMENPNLGMHRLTWNEVYDFQVGDEFHYEGEDQGTCWGSTPPIRKKRIELVTGVQDGPNQRTVEFYVYYWQQTLEPIPNYTYITVTSQGSISRVYSMIDSTVSHAMPNEAEATFTFQYYEDDTIALYYPVSFDQHASGRFSISYANGYSYSLGPGAYGYDNVNGGWSMLPTVSGAEYTTNWFGTGIGRTDWYHYLDNSFDVCFEKEESLVYFKKGQMEWGDPISLSLITGIDVNDELRNTTVYPNPVRKGSNIFLGSTCNQLDVYDLTGKQIIKAKDVRHMQTDNLKLGIYLLRINSESGVSTQKLVVTD